MILYKLVDIDVEPNKYSTCLKKLEQKLEDSLI